MALEATFRGLTAAFRELYDVVNRLHISMEDKLDEDGTAVALDLSDLTLKMMGNIHDAHRAALKASRSLRDPAKTDQARRGLILCQEHFHLIEQDYAANMLSYKILRELARIHGRYPKLAEWVDNARKDIEQCRVLLEKTSKALAACWQELVESGGKISIAVTNTGQKIIAREPLVDERFRQRMT